MTGRLEPPKLSPSNKFYLILLENCMTIFTVTVHATELTRLKAEADAAYAAWYAACAAAYAACDAAAYAAYVAAWEAWEAAQVAAWEAERGEK